jgi:hypothetical protein
VRELLDQLAQLEGTPLARTRARARRALPDCESVGAHAPDGDVAKLAERSRCLRADDPLERSAARAERSRVRAAARAGDRAARRAAHRERRARARSALGRPPAAAR